jgi:hypothetical protein
VRDAAGDEDEGSGVHRAGDAVELELRRPVQHPEGLDAIWMTMRRRASPTRRNPSLVQ